MIIIGGYADGFLGDEGPSTINQFRRHVDSLFTNDIGVHLLPVAPSSGDSGFAPDDWCAVRPELGTWADIRALATDRPLILDGIYNHVGIGHPWVRRIAAGSTEAEALVHAFADDVDPVSAPTSPRGGSVLRPFGRAGRRLRLWQSFTSAAVDVRLDHPAVLAEVARHMDTLARNYVWGVRLDAVAYYQKAISGPVRHAPGAHLLASQIAQMAVDRGLEVSAQLDIDEDGRRYFASPAEAGHVMNDFGYAVALACSFATGSADPVAGHVQQLDGLARVVSRCPRNHDGLLLRSKLLNNEVREQFVRRCEAAGIRVRSEGSIPYEVNESGPTLYALLRPDGDAMAMVEMAVALTAVLAERAYLYLPFVLACASPMLPELIQHDVRLPNRAPVQASDLRHFHASGGAERLQRLFEALALSHGRQSEGPRANRASIIQVDEGLLYARTKDGVIHLAVNFGPTSTSCPEPLRSSRPWISTSALNGSLTPLSYSLYVDDRHIETSPSGRRHHQPRSGTMSTGAIDIGGSSVKYGLVDIDRGRARLRSEFEPVPLPDNEFGSLREIVEDVARTLHADHGAACIGISTTGSVDRHGVVVSAGHFDGYVNVSWQDVLRTSLPGLERVATTNDGRASAWAEFSTEGDERSSLVHAVVGTGVGGGIVYEGKLLLGDSGQSGYIGHIKVSEDSPVICSCGNRGCVEALSSARAIAAAYLPETDGKAGEPTFETVVAAASNGDEKAIRTFQKAGWWLGRGLGNAMNVVNPAVVTIGGGVALAATEALSTQGLDYLGAVREGIESAAHRRVFATAEVRAARYGNDSGLLGAALLAG